MDSNDLQRELLAALLNNPDNLGEVSDILAGRKVFTGINQRIYDTMTRLYTEGSTLDPVTLSCAVGKGKGSAEVLSLPLSSCYGNQAKDYARYLVDYTVKRDLAHIAQDLLATKDNLTGAELLADAERKVFALSNFSTRRPYRNPGEIAGSVVQELRDAREGKVIGITSGLYDLDAVLGGAKRGDVVIIAGRPSQGKTALAKTWILNGAKIGFRAGFFSVEMRAQQIVLALACALCGVDSFRAQMGRVDDDEERRIEMGLDELMRLPIFIDDNPMNYLEMRSRARKLKSEQKIDILFVDYLQLIPGSRMDNSEPDIAMVSHMAKLIAKELDIPVVMLSQLSRANEYRADKRPTLSDLRGSGTIEQDADVVVFVHGPLDDKCLIVAKHRNGPINGNIPVLFNPQLTLFQNKSLR
jgi:replicative DNA helicase